jgi:hypothetical protein
MPANTAKSSGLIGLGSDPAGHTAPSNPTSCATIFAVAGASPVTMTVRTPSALSSEIRESESSRGGSLSAMNPTIWMEGCEPAATAKTRNPCFSSSSAIAAARGAAVVRVVTALKAPLMIRCIFPFASVAVASEIFLAGSKGTK